MDNSAKVTYTTLEGVDAVAYIDFTDDTWSYGTGIDKHTDKPVAVQWVENMVDDWDDGRWEEVDTGVEYSFDVISGVWSEVARG